MSFFAELKRRNVFRVGAAYLLVAWLLMQVTDTLVPALHLPSWIATAVARRASSSRPSIALYRSATRGTIRPTFDALAALAARRLANSFLPICRRSASAGDDFSKPPAMAIRQVLYFPV